MSVRCDGVGQTRDALEQCVGRDTTWTKKQTSARVYGSDEFLEKKQTRKLSDQCGSKHNIYRGLMMG